MNNISKGDNIMNQPADNKKIMDFLLYSYFGFSSGDLDQTRKVKCSYRAYLDLARTVKYTYSSTELEKATVGTDAHAFIDIRKKRIEDVCSKLIESIEDFPNCPDDFDTWHDGRCAQIICQMNTPYDDGRKKFLKDGFTFTYGQAQKWVNMTLKYLWLLDMLPKGLSEAKLHVPVDSFILEALKETQQFNTKGNKITGSGESYYYNGEAWSAISEYKNYKKLQDGIRNIAEKQGISPIQWEGSAWMDVAKKRSSK